MGRPDCLFVCRYQQQLIEHIKSHPGFVSPPEKHNEILRRLEEPLQDLSCSRASFSWGVPVPGDEKHVMYVWFDALTNYISGEQPRVSISLLLAALSLLGCYLNVTFSLPSRGSVSLYTSDRSLSSLSLSLSLAVCFCSYLPGCISVSLCIVSLPLSLPL